MKRLFHIIVAVLICVGIGYYASGRLNGGPADESTSTPDLTSEVSNTHVRGVITDINGEQAMVDGPYLVSVTDDKGVEFIISVPSRGFQLCAAKDTIASPYDLKKGMTIEVKGALTSGGSIVPCESAHHYLRVVK